MLDLNFYLDAAKKAQDIDSDRALGRLLGVSGSMVSQWRTHRAWPGDGQIVKIARMAHMDINSALLNCAAWKADADARPYYENMMKRLSGMAASICLILVALSQNLA